MSHRIVQLLQQWGYGLVDPPLIEFEESLLPPGQERLNQQTFRLLDPVSRRILGVRADLTTQIARIATSRLKSQPRPLRLCYAGDVLRVSGSQLRPERQFFEIGAELIGTRAINGDIEIMRLVLLSLAGCGVSEGLTLDLTLPSWVPLIVNGYQIASEVRERLRASLDHKDDSVFAELPPDLASLLTKLVAASGTAKTSIEKLRQLHKSLPTDRLEGNAIAEQLLQCSEILATSVEALSSEFPKLTITIDTIENRGFDYHSQLGFAVFSAAMAGELARGGRYRAGKMDEQESTKNRFSDLNGGEAAVGMTVFLDTVLKLLPSPQPAECVFVPMATPISAIMSLQQQGFVTVVGLQFEKSLQSAARLQGCSHIYHDQRVISLDEFQE